MNTRPNGWSYSPSTISSGASSSSISPIERTERIRKSQKRRTPSAATAASTSTSPGNSNLDSKIQKLVALLPLVSKQADENAKREQEALRERQRKQRRTARSLKDSSTRTKKSRTSTGIRGKRRDVDTTDCEEEMSISERPEGEVRQNERVRLRECDTARPDKVSRLMPPPSYVPIRNSFPKPELSPPLPTIDEHVWIGQSSRKAETTAAPSFTSTSIATSTAQLPSLQGSIATRAQCTYPSPSAGDHAMHVAPNDASTPAASPSVSGPMNSNVSYYKPSPTPSTHKPHTNSIPHRTSQGRTSTPPHLQSDRTPCLPKTNGPPALGMRRHVNGLTPSLSQGLTSDRPLPIKRSQFKVPFARNGVEQYDHSPGSTQRHNHSNASTSACSGSSSSLSGHTQGSDPSTQSPVSHSVRRKAPSASSSSITTDDHKTETTRVADAADSRSSPPPADADSSIDFDMDFDPEELEKVCSAFD